MNFLGNHLIFADRERSVAFQRCLFDRSFKIKDQQIILIFFWFRQIFDIFKFDLNSEFIMTVQCISENIFLL